MQLSTIVKRTVLGAFSALLLIGGCSSIRIVSPGEMGVSITLGQASPYPLGPGFYVRMPIVNRVETVNVQTSAEHVDAACFSSDLQTLTAKVRVIYSYSPEKAVVLYTQYAGTIRDKILSPTTQECLKEVTALRTAENIVKQRDLVKAETLALVRKKMGPFELLTVHDLVIENIDLSNELESAIERKMVREQQAQEARFTQEKAEIDAATAIIQAKGEAEALRVRGEALRQQPEIIMLNAVEKWNGVLPATVVVGEGVSPMLPVTQAK